MKDCPKCGDLLRYDPYFKADICDSCDYFKKRTDTVLLQTTLRFVAEEGRKRGIASGLLLNKAVDIAIDLQATQKLSLVQACEIAFMQLAEAQ